MNIGRLPSHQPRECTRQLKKLLPNLSPKDILPDVVEIPRPRTTTLSTEAKSHMIVHPRSNLRRARGGQHY